MKDEFKLAQNTDQEIWRQTPGDFYSASLHVTQEGCIGLNVGGHVFVLPPEEWHRAAKLYRKWQRMRESRWYKLGQWLGIYPRISHAKIKRRPSIVEDKAMHFQGFMNIAQQAANGEAWEMCSQAGQMTLGELQARLEAANPSAVVQFEDGTPPGTFHSYRGYYQFIAVGLGDRCTVADFLERVRMAIGGTFSGWKGGEYKMTRMTPVWVAGHGLATGVGLVDVLITEDVVTLKTKVIEEI